MIISSYILFLREILFVFRREDDILPYDIPRGVAVTDE